jgi:ribonuclease HI
MAYLLMPGEAEVDVFSDASACDGLRVGSWAYRIPTFGVNCTGIELGTHIERFELVGAVSGIEAAARFDTSARPIHVYTDSQFAMSVLTRLGRAATLPSRQSYDRVRDLVKRATTALGPRILLCSRCNGESADHLRCHLDALREIRAYVDSDLRLRRDLAVHRAEQKLSQFLTERIQLEEQMLRLDRKVAISETNLHAIREFWRGEMLR